MILALTLDLDDTLWPVAPVIDQAEHALQDWLARHAPATARRFDRAAMRAWRAEVGHQHPERSHDLSWLRLHSIALALQAAGDDPALAQPAFDWFFRHRQQVQPYDDVPQALSRLAARWPILALTNGNADVMQTALGPFFQGSLGAREFGQAKPQPAFFHAACARLGVVPHAVLHIGDDWALDIEGACAAGLQAAWVNRTAAKPQGPARPQHVASHLAALADALGV